MSSFDRLIELAKRTGDRLIVHDPYEGKDMVILDVDSYEHLVLGKRSVRGLSERELIDQINRDISIWRANQEEEETWERGAVLEDELIDNPPFDPFEEDFAHRSDWHSAGSVMKDRYTPDFSLGEDTDDEGEDIDEEDEDGDAVQYWEPINDEPLYTAPQADVSVAQEPDDYRVTDPDMAFETPHQPVPHRETPREDDTQWKEEPLSPEEPVFYEEPV